MMYIDIMWAEVKGDVQGKEGGQYVRRIKMRFMNCYSVMRLIY
jgi:hypothetical protein